MSAKSNKSTSIQWRVMRIGLLTAFRTMKISTTAIATWIIQMTAKMAMRKIFNLI
jgi:hypothetical protein